jgi:micrococcal nuclease
MHLRLIKIILSLLILGGLGIGTSIFIFKDKPASISSIGTTVSGYLKNITQYFKDEGPYQYGDYIKVTRVIDGDTVLLENGERLRYIGINAPELGKTEATECFALEATTENQRLVEGQNIRIEKDVSERDKYGRLLGYVYLKDGTFVNMHLVENGFAHAAAYPPDIAKSTLFTELEKEARIGKRGLWNLCN